MTALETLLREYRVAFLHYLPRREETALHRAYELGRSAVIDGLSILEFARVHHEVLAEALRETPPNPEDITAVAEAASQFFGEALAPFELAYLVLRESVDL